MPAPNPQTTNKVWIPLQLTRLQAEEQTGGNRRPEYGVTFIKAGYVRQRDGQPSSWKILAGALQAAVPLFNARGMQIDHASLATWFYPPLKDTAAVTFGATWNEENQSIDGGARLYGRDDLAWFRQFLDDLLADQEAGLEVPDVGLSAVLYDTSEWVEAGEEREQHSTEIRHVETVDFVFGPGAEGRLHETLSMLGQSVFVFGEQTSSGKSPADELRPGGRSPDIVLGSEHPRTSGERAERPRELEQVQGGQTIMDEQLNSNGSEEAQTEETAPQAASAPEADLSATEPESGEAPPTEAQAPPPAAELTALSTQVVSLGQQVERLTGALAGREDDDLVEGMGQAPRAANISPGYTSLEKVEAAFLAMLNGVLPPSGVQPLTGIRELYHLMSGDYEMTGLFNADRVMLANVNSATMAGLVADALNKRVVNLFQEYPKWWEPAVTPEDFTSLQDVKWITLGGVGELPTVPEGGSYHELTWDDQTETDPFVKKGGYLGITLESIDKDDTRKLLAAPRALAQAAWLTLGKAVSNIFTGNSGVGSTMSDGVALFHTDHGNVGTSPFSPANWRATKIAMMKQTELNSGERLGALAKPHLVWVPVDLEDYAVEVLGSEGKADTDQNNVNVDADGDSRSTRLAHARRRVIACPLWTDSNDWAAQADPRLYPSIGLGFRYGRTPEIYSVASPTAGLMFSNDTMPVKVRFFFAVGPTDWRGLHKQNVA